MPKGVEKIGLANPNDNNIIFGKGSKYSPMVRIKGDKIIDFEVEYYKDTPQNSKGNAKWVIKPTAKYPFTKNDQQVHKGDKIGVSIPKKFCGPKAHMVEAFGYSPVSQFPTMVVVTGQTSPRIISTSWSKTKEGTNIKNGNPIKYGDDIWLNVQTEGLNESIVEVTVYNRELGSNRHIYRYRGIKCYNGEINLNIKNTYTWQGIIPWAYRGNVEEFYVQINLKGDNTLIIDNINDTKHAVYLKIKDEVSNKTIEKSTFELPLKIGKLEVDVERYAPCSFDKITVTEPKKNSIPVFEKGNNLTGRSVTNEKIKRSVFFKYDSSELTPETKGKLNDLIDFLSSNKKTYIELNGYASIEGKESYNKLLSQRRANAVKDYLIQGKLDGARIISQGKGELKPTGANDDDEPKENRDEKKYSEARKVEIIFTYSGQNANALVYNTVAGSPAHSKNISVEIQNMFIEHCYRESNKHVKKVIIVSPDSKATEKDASGKFSYPVFSNLPEQTDFFRSDYYAPLKYIWPSSCESNNFYFFINSCGYFADKDKASLIVKVFPDIKWTFAVELAINISNLKSANMPSGTIWQKHWEDAQPAGVNRSLINRTDKDGKLTAKSGVPVKWGFGLEAEWNNKSSKREVGITIKHKIKKFTSLLQTTANVLNEASDWSIKAAKKSGLPITFNIIYPTISIGASWSAEGGQKKGELATVGEIGLVADPLIGAVGTIDIIAAAAIGIGSPAVGKLISKFRGTVEELGASIRFDIIFKGELYVRFPKLIIHSIEGVKTDGDFVAGGRLSMTIQIEATNNAVGTITAQKPVFILEIKASVTVGVGGELNIGSDKTGFYVQPVLKFSGAKIVAKIHGEFGFWSFLGFDYNLEEVVIKPKTTTLKKSYLI